MEPIPLFDNAAAPSAGAVGAKAAMWFQTEVCITITVPLPADVPAGAKPQVTIRPTHLTVRCPRTSQPKATEEATAGADDDRKESETSNPADITATDDHEQTKLEDACVETLETLLDNDFSGEVSLDESAWTVIDGLLTIDLSKKAVYDERTPSAAPRPMWWPCAVRGGKTGPEDPKAIPKPQPNIQRLDAKIGEQCETTGKFQGKSKFQW